MGIAELQPGMEDFCVSRMMEARMKFADALRYLRRVGGMSFQQVLGLMLEVIEIGIGRERSYRHDELPFVRPRSAYDGQKVSSQRRIVLMGWTSVLSADRMRP